MGVGARAVFAWVYVTVRMAVCCHASCAARMTVQMFVRGPRDCVCVSCMWGRFCVSVGLCVGLHLLGCMGWAVSVRPCLWGCVWGCGWGCGWGYLCGAACVLMDAPECMVGRNFGPTY